MRLERGMHTPPHTLWQEEDSLHATTPQVLTEGSEQILPPEFMLQICQ